jgi:hypothetical protein
LVSASDRYERARREHLAQVEDGVVERELAGLDLREVEDVGEDALEAARALEDLLEVLASHVGIVDSRSARRARPSRPFSGVRISWLVLARNALLARLAASAASRAAASAASRRRAR